MCQLHHRPQSIEQLNTIFRELSILIVDQGTILDRIDYNLETTVHHIEEGNKELIQVIFSPFIKISPFPE